MRLLPIGCCWWCTNMMQYHGEETCVHPNHDQPDPMLIDPKESIPNWCPLMDEEDLFLKLEEDDDCS